MIKVLVLALVCLLGTGLVHGQNGCEFTELSQGLRADTQANQDHLVDISDAQKCQDVCCTRDDCQLALIETPADGSPQCVLVNCMKDGKYVCGFEASYSSKVYRKNNVSRDYCHLENDVGSCRASFPRFYYDDTNQTCKSFVYGGCGGNSNNFISMEDCQNACSGVTGNALTETPVSSKSRKSLTEETPDKSDPALPEMSSGEYAEKCLAASEVGLCRASIVRYYYTSGTCKRFRYGGCGGNKNNYDSEEECMNTCTVKVVDSEKTHEDQEACFVPSDAGPCRAAFRMFYYEPRTQSCQEFIYGGCKGNKNRYNTPEECMSNCAGKEGGFEEHWGHGMHRGRWNPAFFLVTALAIMSVVLLVGLLVISVRRVKHQRLFLLDDKQELLPEEHVPEEVHSDH